MARLIKYRRLFRVSALVLAAVWLWPKSALGLTFADERQMGRQAFVAIQHSEKLVDDPVITDYVNEIGRKILSTIGHQPFDYRFFVIEKDVINAFAVPGGYVFLNTETIASMNTEGELAAVIAHEIAHVTSRHIVRRIENSRKVSLATVGGILAGVLIGGPVGPAVAAGSMGGGIQALLAYSREDESQADFKGLEYLVAAGYNARNMVGAFENMLKSSTGSHGETATYLSTHPGLGQRIQEVADAVTSHASLKKGRGDGDQKAFDAVRTRVIAMYADEARAENQVNALLTKNPKGALGYYGRALLLYRKQKVGEALESLRTALKIDPANASFLTDLGDILFRKEDFDGAVSAFSRAVVLRPDDTRPLFMLGRVYQEEDNLPKAQDMFERVLRLDPNHPEALNQIGVVYGRRGDLARAHLHTGLYYKWMGRNDKALMHFKEAKRRAETSPYDVQDRIENELRLLQAEMGKKVEDEPESGEQ